MVQVKFSIQPVGGRHAVQSLRDKNYRFQVDDIFVVISSKLLEGGKHNGSKLIAYGAYKALELMGRQAEGLDKTYSTILIEETYDHKLKSTYTGRREPGKEVKNLEVEKELLLKIKTYKDSLEDTKRDLAAARRGRDMHYEHEQVMKAKFEASEAAYNQLREENARLVRRIAELEKGGEIIEAPVAVDAVDVTTVSRVVCPEERLDILFRAIDRLTK